MAVEDTGSHRESDIALDLTFEFDPLISNGGRRQRHSMYGSEEECDSISSISTTDEEEGYTEPVPIQRKANIAVASPQYNLPPLRPRKHYQDVPAGERKLQRQNASKNKRQRQRTQLVRSRILQEELESRLIWQTGTYGHNFGQFVTPTDVAYNKHSARLVVADPGNARLQVMSHYGQMTNYIGQGMIFPRSLAYDAKGFAYATNCIPSLPSLTVFDQNGYQAAVWGEADFVKPKGVAVTKFGNIVVSDEFHENITIFSSAGKTMQKFRPVNKKKESVQPARLAINSKDCIIVSDTKNDLIKTFDPNGKFLWEFSPKSISSNRSYSQQGICVDRSDNILVTLYYDHTIAKFSPDGKFMGFELTANDGLHFPVGITQMEMEGKPYLALTENDPNTKKTAIKMMTKSRP